MALLKQGMALLMTLVMMASIFVGGAVPVLAADEAPAEGEPPVSDVTEPESAPDPEPDPEPTPDSEPELAPAAEVEGGDVEEALPREVEALLALAREDGKAAAEALNAEADDEAFLYALGKILDVYYGEAGYEEQLAAFVAAVDARAGERIAAYEAAAAQRAEAVSLGMVPGQVLVVFEEDVAGGEAASVAAAQSAPLAESWALEDGALAGVAELPLDVTVEEAVAQFEEAPAVAFAQPNYLYESAAYGGVDDPGYTSQYYMKSVNAIDAWAKIYASMTDAERKARDKVRVAVIDNPIGLGHPDLKEPFEMALDKSMIANFYDHEDGSTEWMGEPYFAETDGHGTHMAGIIGATSNNKKGIVGVAAGYTNDIVDLIPINVFDRDPKSPYYNFANSAGVSQAIRYAADPKLCGAQVLNLSLFFVGKTGAGVTPNDALITRSIEKARTEWNAVVVASVANRGSTDKSFPADVNGVLGVVSLKEESTTTNNDTKANYASTSSSPRHPLSNYGGDYVSAPGTNVYSTMQGSYKSLTGTSCAAAVASGVAALVRYANPNLSETQVRDILKRTARDVYTPGFDNETGYGCLDAAAAVTEAMGQNKIFLSASPVPSDGHVMLSWTASPTDTAYNISFSENADMTGATTISSVNSPYDFSLPSPGATYYFRVEGANNGNKSNIVSATYPLLAPGLTATDLENGAIDLDWTRPAGTTGELTYRVYVNTNATGSQDNAYYAKVAEFKSADASGTYTYTDTKAGIDYRFKIEAVLKTADGVDVVSPQAGPAMAAATFPAPVLSVTDKTATSVTLQWPNAADVDGYYLYRAESETGKYTRVATVARPTTSVDYSYEAKGLSAAKDYYFYLVGYKVHGGKTRVGDNGPLLKNVRTLLPAPTGLKVQRLADGTAKISWNKVSGATGYGVEYWDGTYWVELASPRGNATTSVSLVLEHEVDTVRVRAARTRNLATDYSDYATADAGDYQYKAPTLYVQSMTATTITVAWDRQPGYTGGYNVYKADGKKTDYSGFSLVSNVQDTSYQLSAAGTTSIYVVPDAKDVPENYSNIVTATPVAMVSSAPTIAGRGYDWLDVKWDSAAGTDYRLYRAASLSGPFSLVATVKAAGATTTHRDTGLLLGQSYYYRVCAAVIASGEVVESPLSPVSHAGVPALIYLGDFQNNQVPLGAEISWPSAEGATGFEIWDVTPGKAPKRLTTRPAAATTGTSITYTHGPLQPGTQTVCELRGYRTIGGKKYYAAENITFDMTAGDLPAVTVNGPIPDPAKLNTMKLSWDATAYATTEPRVSGYKVWRKTASDPTYKLVATLAGKTRSEYTDQYAPADLTGYKITAYCTIKSKRYEGGATEMNFTGVPSLAAASIQASPSDGDPANRVSINLPKGMPDGAKGIRLYRMASGETAYKLIATLTKERQWPYHDNAPSGLNVYKAVAYYTRGGKVVEGEVFDNRAGTGDSSVREATAVGLGKVKLYPPAHRGDEGWKNDKSLYYSIRLNWSRNPKAAGYFVYRMAPGETEFTLIKTLSGSKKTTYTDAALPVNDPSVAGYQYKVAPYRTAGGKKLAGEMSNVDGGNSFGLPGVTQVTATPGSALYSMVVEWDAVADASGYHIYSKGEEPSQSWEWVGTVAGGSKTTFTHKGVSDLSCYTVVPYRTVAKQKMTTAPAGEGVNSAQSGIVAQINRLPAPAGLTAKATAAHTVKLSWTRDPRASGYRIYRSTGQGRMELVKTVGKTGTFTDKPLDAATYHYQVNPILKVGKKTIEASWSKTFVTATGLAAVNGFAATRQSATSVKVSWQKRSGASGYYVYAAGADGVFRQVGSTTKTSLTLKNLATGVTEFKVAPYYKSGGKTATGTVTQVVSAP